MSRNHNGYRSITVSTFAWTVQEHTVASECRSLLSAVSRWTIFLISSRECFDTAAISNSLNSWCYTVSRTSQSRHDISLKQLNCIAIVLSRWLKIMRCSYSARTYMKHYRSRKVRRASMAYDQATCSTKMTIQLVTIAGYFTETRSTVNSDSSVLINFMIRVTSWTKVDQRTSWDTIIRTDQASINSQGIRMAILKCKTKSQHSSRKQRKTWQKLASS